MQIQPVLRLKIRNFKVWRKHVKVKGKMVDRTEEILEILRKLEAPPTTNRVARKLKTSFKIAKRELEKLLDARLVEKRIVRRGKNGKTVFWLLKKT